MIIPSRLNTGDLIIITAPARKIFLEQLSPSLQLLQEAGFRTQVVLPSEPNQHNYLASSDHNRLKSLQTCFDHPEAKAVICARGGYGTSRIVDSIDWTSLLKTPKWIVGFSDITHLHLAATTFNLVTIHGTMPVQLEDAQAVSSLHSLIARLCGDLSPMVAAPSTGNKPGSASGRLVGGNLSILVDSLGTKNQPDLTNCILFLEEIDEPAYKIDRMIHHLKRTGILDNLAGVAIGYFTKITEGQLPFGESYQEIIHSCFNSANIPIAFNFLSGHEVPNQAWYSGMKATLEVDANGSTLTFNPAEFW